MTIYNKQGEKKKNWGSKKLVKSTANDIIPKVYLDSLYSHRADVMRNLTNQKNEWLVLELRLCRAALGISQKQLSELTGLAIQSIKRLEKKGAQPRYTTINLIRQTFKDLGVNCQFSDDGQLMVELSDELINALNDGAMDEYIKNKSA